MTYVQKKSNKPTMSLENEIEVASETVSKNGKPGKYDKQRKYFCFGWKRRGRVDSWFDPA